MKDDREIMKGELVMVLDTTIHTNILPAADVLRNLIPHRVSSQM